MAIAVAEIEPDDAELPLIERFRGARIAVIGDVMIDHHVVGKVGRISEEAPVPVLLVQAERRTLGGAANVAANIASLGGRAVLIGMIGDDLAGANLVQMIEAQRGRANEGEIEPRLAPVRDRPTVAKTRYLGGHQQIVRVDREFADPAPREIEAFLIEEIEEALSHCELAIASDYGKGVLTDRVLGALFAACEREKKKCIVDPKRVHFSDYRGATLITPNRKELSIAMGLPTETDEEAERAADKAIRESGAAILLTRSEKGMTLYRADTAPLHLPAEALEVFDVSGAGDTRWSPGLLLAWLPLSPSSNPCALQTRPPASLWQSSEPPWRRRASSPERSECKAAPPRAAQRLHRSNARCTRESNGVRRA